MRHNTSRSPRRGRLGPCLALLGLGLCANPLGAQLLPHEPGETAIGYVQALHGSWADDTHTDTTLRPGAAVRLDSRIQATSPDASTFLALRVFGLDEVVDFSCAAPAACRGVLDLGSVLRRRHADRFERFRRIFEALDVLPDAPPPGWEVLVAEAGETEEGPADAVVELSEAASQVAKSFAGLPSGRYKGTIGRFGGPDRPADVIIEWPSDRPPALPALSPGLYDLQLARGENIDARPLRDCILLAVTGEDRSRATALLALGREYAATWKDAGRGEGRSLERLLMLSSALSAVFPRQTRFDEIMKAAEEQLRQGNMADAGKMFTAAVQLSKASKPAQAEARRGLARTMLGSVEAEAEAQQALSLDRSRGGDVGELKDLLILSETYQMRGYFAKALAALADAVPIARRRGLREEEAQALEAKAAADQALSNYEEALTSYQEALDLERRGPGRLSVEIRLETGLGVLNSELGSYEEAERHLQSAVVAARQVRARLPPTLLGGQGGSFDFSLEKLHSLMEEAGKEVSGNHEASENPELPPAVRELMADHNRFHATLEAMAEETERLSHVYLEQAHARESLAAADKDAEKSNLKQLQQMEERFATGAANRHKISAPRSSPESSTRRPLSWLPTGCGNHASSSSRCRA